MGNVERLTTLLKTSDTYEYKRGDSITDTDDVRNLWFVDEGYVKRYQILNSGVIRTQGFYGPQDAFPLTYVFQLLMDRDIYHGPETYFYEALGNVKLYKLQGEVLKKAVGEDPLLYKDLLSLSGNRFASNIQLLENYGLGDAHRRVAHQLLFYAKRFGAPVKKGTSIPMPMTQQDLADLLSLTRETVSVSMRELKNKQLVSGTREIIVTDMDLLEQEAYS